mgnify:CR=1 FL=1
MTVCATATGSGVRSRAQNDEQTAAFVALLNGVELSRADDMARRAMILGQAFTHRGRCQMGLASCAAGLPKPPDLVLLDPLSADEVSAERLLRSLLLDGLDGLCDALWRSVTQLVDSRAATATDLASKFVSEDGAHSLRLGSQKDFFGGLEGLVGPPAPNAFDAMEREHTRCADARTWFTTSNYRTHTNSTIVPNAFLKAVQKVAE